MALHGPVILIEDDRNDLDLLINALKDNNMVNDIRSFTNTADALKYLLTTHEKPFVILCDILMPEKNGLDFRLTINNDEYLKKKSIPFVFFTGIVSEDIIMNAYELGAQGFFRKPGNYEALKKQLASIIYYWSECLHPNV